MNEMRNELLLIRNMELGKKEDRNFYLENILERFQYDIERQLEELENKKEDLEMNKRLLETVRKEILKK